MFKSRFFGNLNIKVRLLIHFLLIAFLPLLIVTSINYQIFIRHLNKEIINHLTAVADSKVNQIESYLEEKRRSVSALSYMPGIADTLARLQKTHDKLGFNSSEFHAIDKEVRPFLINYQQEADYYDLFLIAPDGDIVFAAAKESDYGTNLKSGQYKDGQLAMACDNASTLMQTQISAFEFYNPSNEPTIFIATPIIRNRVVIGVVAIQIKNDRLYSIINDYIGLGQTGEIVVAAEVDNETIAMAPLRYDPDAAMKRRFASESVSSIQKAVKGNRGFDISIDYRGTEVLAVRRYVPLIQWGLIVKMDTSEAFSAAAKLRKTVIVLAVVILFTTIFLAISISKSISGPIIKLTHTTEIIASGDLSARVEIESKDEIGQLAKSFNIMAEARKQTDEKLASKNKELQNMVYIASHDLQSPLANISGYNKRLDKSCKKLNRIVKDITFGTDSEPLTTTLEEDIPEALNYINSGITKMKALLDNLLQVSRVGMAKLNIEPLDMTQFVDSVIKNMNYQVSQSNAEIVVDELPFCIGDSNQMNQVFTNLIDNALKYLEPHRNGIVHIYGKVEDNRSVYYVEDNGIGIEQGYQQKVFELFQRLNPRDGKTGEGLGLTIVKRSVENQNGNIKIESQLGEGTRFTVSFPTAESLVKV